jgi:ABC-type polysaccharide/polyol phosphate export permease
MGGKRPLRIGLLNAIIRAMKKWWMVGLVVILFLSGVVWRVVDVKNCTDQGGAILAPLTGHQECVKR